MITKAGRFTFIVHCIFSPFQLSGLLLFQDELECGVGVLVLRGGGGSGGGASGSHSENIVHMRAQDKYWDGARISLKMT